MSHCYTVQPSTDFPNATTNTAGTSLALFNATEFKI